MDLHCHVSPPRDALPQVLGLRGDLALELLGSAGDGSEGNAKAAGIT